MKDAFLIAHPISIYELFGKCFSIVSGSTESIASMPPIMCVSSLGATAIPAIIISLDDRTSSATEATFKLVYSRVPLSIEGLESKTAYTLSAVINFSPASVPKISGA